MRKAVIGGIVIAVVAAAAVLLGRTTATPSEASVGESHVVRVARRDLGYVVKATGVIKPMIGAEVRVGSRASGVVQRLFARVGDRIEKGQLLAQLDVRELTARRREAFAALELAEANLSYARADLQRKRALETANLVSADALDLAQRACAVAEKQYSGAQASLEYTNTQLDYARIVAPITGVVASVATQEGETVAASLSAPTFVTLLDLTRLELWAYVDETDIGRIQIGQSARFTVDTYPDHEFEGEVTAVYPQAEIRDNVVNYVTVVRFAPPSDRTLRPEMTATVRIALDRRANVLTLPLGAVRREGGRPFVLVRRGEKIERRSITTGSRDESYWEIVTGLREGDAALVGDVKTE